MDDGVWILGGYQSDFARNLSKENRDFADLTREVVDGTLTAAKVDAADLAAAGVVHVANAFGEMFARQGHLGAMPAPRVSPYPAVFQDVSLVVAADIPAQAVADAVRAGAGDLLEDIALFDVFTGPQIGEHRKSLTFALRFRAPDRTLTEDDASAARDAAVQSAAERVGAVLRG